MIKKEKFNPSIIGFFINHNFNIRRQLYIKIKKFAPELNGRVLDFGCGSKPYKPLFLNTNHYIGVDYLIEGRTENIDVIDFFYDGKKIHLTTIFLMELFVPKYSNMFLILMKF